MYVVYLPRVGTSALTLALALALALALVLVGVRGGLIANFQVAGFLSGLLAWYLA